MSYEVHITRAPEDWSLTTGFEIDADEWCAVADADPDLERVSSGALAYVGRGLREDGSDLYLEWFDGNVDAKSPDPAVVRKMLALATPLDARVVGDDGEDYATEDGWRAGFGASRPS